MSRPSTEKTTILTGAMATLMTAAVIGTFAKVLETSETVAKQGIQLTADEGLIASLRLDVARLSVDLSEERIENAKTRTMCERWARKVKDRLGD